MNAITTTRRAALGIIAAAPIAVATGALAFTPRATAADRAEWDQAFARHEEAKAATTAFDTDVHAPMLKAWERAQKQVPHVTTVASFENAVGERVHFTTASEGSIRAARFALAEFPDLARKDNDYVRAARELIEADDARSVEFERRRQECGYYGVCDRSEALSELENEAWHKLIRMPAPDGRALMWKMQELWGGDDGDGYSDGWTMDIVEFVLADARRLLRA